MSNMPPISLQEVLDLMDSLPVEDAMNNEQISNFIYCVDSARTDILKDVGDEKLMGAVAFIQSASITPLFTKFMQDGDIVGAMEMLSLTKSSTFSQLIALAFKMSVGLAALEEWK